MQLERQPSSQPGFTLGDTLIPVINRLQDIFSQVAVDLPLQLPQVAVVGSQSSGKSSVLEAIVGRDFLPRGSDIVTRRPLVLQLVKSTGRVPPASPVGSSPGKGPGTGVQEWGEFLHAPGKIFTDFNRIREEIQAETDRVVGTNKNVSEKPIRLKIFSPHVLTMTLVDLPGTTKVPVGDQPSNIEARIREMLLAYIASPAVIILAVSPANGDLANSDAIQIARMVDPEGLRTIGVLTKLDIMDRGTNAAHILRGLHIPLRLGYTAVVNRSQEDINLGTSVEAARRAEERFFSQRSEYRDFAGSCGVVALSRKLNTLLADHIRGLLPALRKAISDQLEARGAELRSLGEPLAPDSKSARGAYLLQLLCQHAERFAAMLEGRHQDFSAQRLTGGARIRAIFTDGFATAMREMAPVKDVSDEAILTIIKNGAGVAGNLLVAHEPFELLVRRSVEALAAPALACKEAVHQEMLAIAEQACPKELARFPVLARTLAGAVHAFIKSGADPAERMIKGLLECEHDFINVDHPDFIGGRGAIRAVMSERSARAAGWNKADGLDMSAVSREAAAVSVASREVVPAGVKLGKGVAVQHAGHNSLDVGGKMGNGIAHALSGASGPGPGLKGLPEPAIHSADELLSRTRRRSENGCNGLGLLGADDVLRLGSGSLAVFTSQATWGSSGAPVPAASSSWFTWFGSRSSGERTASSGNFQQELQGRFAGTAPQQQQVTPFTPHTEQEEIEVEVIRRLVDSYFSIVRRNLADAVPKAVMHFMVNNSKRGLQTHLIQQLYKEELLDDLLAEKEGVVRQRLAAEEAMAALQAAASALEEVPQELGEAVSQNRGALGAEGGGRGRGSTFLLADGGQGASMPSSLGSNHYNLQYASGQGYTALNGDALHLQTGRSPGGHSSSYQGPHSNGNLIERSPSMLVAARVASAATASLGSHFGG